MLFQHALYLPAVLGILLAFWLMPRPGQARLLLLAAASAGLLLLVQAGGLPRRTLAIFLAAALALAVLVFWLGRLLRARPRTGLMFAVLLVPLAPLLYFKYLARWVPALDLGIAIPIGISYYTFKHLHFLVESRRGRFADTGLGTYLAYVFFFPMFIAGPIERLANFDPQARAAARPDWPAVSAGLERILVGMAKKFLLVTLVLEPLLPAPEMVAGGAPNLHAWQLIAASFVRLLVTYFDFSGYTDMVIGTGRLFGFRLIENFDFPLLRSSIAEFWRCWHISLSSWARDYVYFPILGRWRRPALALIATMLTIGIWHGAQPGWTLWGLHHGVGLILYGRYQRWADGRPELNRLRDSTAWRIAGMMAVWFWVSLGYSLTMDAGSLGSALRIYARAATLGVIG